MVDKLSFQGQRLFSHPIIGCIYFYFSSHFFDSKTFNSLHLWWKKRCFWDVSINNRIITDIKSSLSFLCLIVSSFLILVNVCHAVPDGIPVLSRVLTPIVSYGPFAFTAGGIYYSAINGRMVVNGDYRRVVPGIISILATTLGLVGLFGADALTVLVS